MALSVSGRLRQVAGHLQAARRDAAREGSTELARAIAQLEQRCRELAGQRRVQAADPPANDARR